ncbi:MAG TPA: hypothetical protein VGH42_07790, partial [Verrucomicrobiae bacterium]
MKTHRSTTSKALLWCCAAFASLQLTAWAQPALVNRYSFNETSGITATDSVSGANATLMNGASFSGSQADLTQIANDVSADGTNGQYIALPANVLSNYSAVT